MLHHLGIAFAAFLLCFATPVLAAREFTDDAGRKITLPDKVERVYAAGPPASVIVFALAPDKLIGWTRVDCVRAIAADLGPDMVPIKSACYFCPASRPWELFWLAGHHPGLLDESLGLERRALTGRHSRFDEVDFGSSWEEMVRDAPSFPSTKTTVGLGRSFAWNHWARLNGVVGDDCTVIRGQRRRFIRLAQQLQADDNALDARAGLASANAARTASSAPGSAQRSTTVAAMALAPSITARSPSGPPA